MTITINGTPSSRSAFRSDVDAGQIVSAYTGSSGPFSIDGTPSGSFATDHDLGTILSAFSGFAGPFVLNGPSLGNGFDSDIDAGDLLNQLISSIKPTLSTAVFSINEVPSATFSKDIDAGQTIATLASTPGPFAVNALMVGDIDVASVLASLMALNGPLVVNGPPALGIFSHDIDVGELLLQAMTKAPLSPYDTVFSINGSTSWPFQNEIDAGYLLSRIVGFADQAINGTKGSAFTSDVDIGAVLMSIAGKSGNLTIDGGAAVGDFADDIDVGELLLTLVEMLGLDILTQQGLEKAIGAYITEDYLKKIAAWYRGNSPKFVDTVRSTINPAVTLQQFFVDLPEDFDLDMAIGTQLDQVGQWVGRSRYVDTPLEGVYFSLDTPGVGFDQGIWRGRFDADQGVDRLDDETYRLLLRGKIAANNWDGTMQGAITALGNIFNDKTIPGSNIYIEDHQDMSMTIGVSGKRPSAIFMSLIGSGKIPIKPEGVNTQYAITSVDGSQIFGFDVNNQYIGGLDLGAWPMLFS